MRPGTPGVEFADRVSRGLPVIPLRDAVLFPGTAMPLIISRPPSLAALSLSLAEPPPLLLLCLQKSGEDEAVTPETLHQTAVAARILSSSPLPNGMSRVLAESLGIVKVTEWTAGEGVLSAKARAENADLPKSLQRTGQALEERLFEVLGQRSDAPPGAEDFIRALPSVVQRLFALSARLSATPAVKQSVFDAPDWARRLAVIDGLVAAEEDALRFGRRLEHEVRASIAQGQKEFLLREQIRKLQAELGPGQASGNPEVRGLQESIQAKGLPPEVEKSALAEAKRLEYVSSASPEYSVIRTYLDWMLELPWNHYTQDTLDSARVKKRLEADHFGLKDVKERILEHVAVLKLAGAKATPILCLIGPPGVGKSSLGSSIAKSLGRNFARISLGGVRDEAEIRGHRRTYIGAMPGKIVRALKTCGSSNPVILLDEIDKMGQDFRGDPASALLEVLDPEQNHAFSDHFIEAGLDLSRVFFITTANVEENIPPALRDRLEIIRIAGYFESEKLAIAKRYLLPKALAASGLKPEQLRLDDKLLRTLISRHTHEAGVRQLSRELARLARKRAHRVVAKLPLPALREADLVKYLGLPTRPDRQVPVKSGPGIVTGLAWTPLGGEILRLECTLLSGRGRLHLTGKLGDVMKESAQIALTLVRERAGRYGIDPAIWQKTDIHLHIPEGAIAKDGPSAGVAMVLALLSAMTRRPINPRIALTGEVSLSGNVHAVGGLPEKTLAALQAGVDTVFIPAGNRQEALELPSEAKKGLRIIEMDHLDGVLAKLLPPTASGKRGKGV